MLVRLLIVGAGGFGGAIAEAATASGLYDIVGFADDRWPALEMIPTGTVIGSVAELARLRARADAVALAIGNGAVRERVAASARAAGFELPAIIHPRSYIAQGVTLGAGVMVLAGAIVGTGSTLGDGVLINAGAVLDHDCQVGAFANVGIAASIGGGCRLAAGECLAQGTTLTLHEGRSSRG